jgi:hypothetical protein
MKESERVRGERQGQYDIVREVESEIVKEREREGEKVRERERGNLNLRLG